MSSIDRTTPSARRYKAVRMWISLITPLAGIAAAVLLGLSGHDGPAEALGGGSIVLPASITIVTKR